MATVPMQQLPEVQMNTQGPGSIQVNQEVKPVKNYMPEQGEKFGASMLKSGTTLTEIGRRMQDQVDDAEAKNLFNQFSDEMAELQLNYSRQVGRDAVTSFDAVNNRVTERMQAYEDAALNDMQRMLFRTKATALRRSTTTSIVSHSISEQRRFQNAETQASVNNFIRGAAAAWTSYDEADGDFNMNLGAALRTYDEYADNNGIPRDSAQYEDGVVRIRTAAHSSVINGLMLNDNFEGARDYLRVQFADGNIDLATNQAFENQIDAGYDRQVGVSTADEIWNSSTSGEGQAGQPSLRDMLSQARAQITDPDQLQYAEARIRDKYNEGVQLQTDEYNSAYQRAQEIAWDTPGQNWTNVPPDVLAALRPADRVALMEGPPRADNPDTVISILQNPTEMLPGNIEKYRPQLSEGTYRSFVAQGVTAQNRPETIRSVTIDSEIWNATLRAQGLENFLDTGASPAIRERAANMRLSYQQLMDAEQVRVGRDLSLTEKQAILDNMLNNTVWVDYTFGDQQMSIYAVPTGDMDDTYVRYTGTGNNRVPPNTEVKLTSIPAAQLSAIQTAMREEGIRFTYQEAINRWVNAGFPGRADMAQQLETLRNR